MSRSESAAGNEASRSDSKTGIRGGNRKIEANQPTLMDELMHTERPLIIIGVLTIILMTGILIVVAYTAGIIP